ncbi:MAG: Holliday junction resolvase RuvX [Bacteroidia bacterium]|nr:Holliday junction resolvase RuvX [Bacteroidia bacterium]
MGRILAIDYGLKRSGLAWTDPTGRVALPLAGVETPQLWDKLSALLPEVDKVIVGYPRQLSGATTTMTTSVELFFSELRRRYPHLSVELVEERLSTCAAQYYLRQLPRRHRQNKYTADQLAATIILESYLLRKRL